MCGSNKMISIIVPVYNAETFLDNCIQSILAQSYENWELILVNDGSKDGSGEICRRYAADDTRIRYYEKQNGGVSSARNIGLEMAEGEFISFVDSDDTVVFDYCERLLEKMTLETDMVVLGMQYVYPDGTAKLVPSRIHSGLIEYEDMARQVIDDGTASGFTLHSVCAVLYRADVIKNNSLRFDIALKYNEDGLFNTEYFLHCQKSTYVCYGHPVYNYRMNAQSATHTLNMEIYVENMKYIEERLRALEAKFPNYGIAEQIEKRRATVSLSKVCYMAGAKGTTVSDIKKALKANQVYKAYRLLRFEKMGRSKRYITRAISMRFYLIVAIILRTRYRGK